MCLKIAKIVIRDVVCLIDIFAKRFYAIVLKQNFSLVCILATVHNGNRNRAVGICNGTASDILIIPRAFQNSRTLFEELCHIAHGIKGIEAGCGTDAPGSYIAWLSTQVPVHAMEMPGSRYDIGNLESYETVQKTYRGITK